MRFTIGSQLLGQYLGGIIKIPTKHPSYPQAAYTRLEVVSVHELVVSVTNMGVFISITLPIIGGEPGVCLIDGGAFLSVTEGVKGDEDVVARLEGNLLDIQVGMNQIQLKTVSETGFPVVPDFESEKWLSVPGVELGDMFKSVVSSASVSDVRPELASVCMRTKGSELLLAATDSFRLCEARVAVVGGIETTALIPVRYCGDIIRVVGLVRGEITVFIAPGTYLEIISGMLRIVVRLVNGAYPDYEQIIPRDPSTTVECVIGEIKSAIKTVLPFTDQVYSKVDIEVNPDDGVFQVVSGMNERGSATANCRGIVAGNPIQMRVNAKNLLDIISLIPDERVIFEFTDPFRPLLIRGSKNKLFRGLLMPMNRS